MSRELRKSWIASKIEKGVYKGKTVEVHFGKPFKVLVDGRDISDWVIEIDINISTRGHTVYLKIAEGAYSQFPETSKVELEIPEIPLKE